MSFGAYYFEFADYIKVVNLLEGLPRGNRLQETADDVIFGIYDFAIEFLKACHGFQGMLWKKAVAEHVE